MKHRYLILILCAMCGLTSCVNFGDRRGATEINRNIRVTDEFFTRIPYIEVSLWKKEF
jgi:hypothetical protein